MSGIGKTLTVNANTTATQLKEFMDTGASEGRTKLVGKRTDEGIVLYFKSDSRSNIFARMFGIAQRRRDAAADAVDQVMAKVENRLTARFQNKEGVKALFEQIRAFPTVARGSALRSELGSAIFKQVIRLETAGELLRPREGAGLAKETRMELINPDIKMAAVGETEPVKTLYGTRDVPSFTLNGNTYVPVKYLAESSFGMVFMYKNAKDDGDLLALKLPVADKEGANVGKLEDEAVTHWKLAGGDNKNDNLLEMKGGLRMADGTPGIIMDFAPNGSLFDLGQSLGLLKGDGRGQVPDVLANAISGSMLTNVADGLGSLHERDYVHNDSKDANVLIGKNGKPVIMDFGETKPKNESFGSQLEVANPRYLTPEILKSKEELPYINEYKKIISSQTEDIENAFESFSEVPKDTVEKLKSEFKDLMKEQTSKDAVEMRKQFDKANFDPVGNDLWSLGTMALMLKSRKQLGEGEKGIVLHNRLKAYSEPLAELKEGKLPPNALMDKTSDTNFNDLVERQFSRDHTKRLRPEEFKEHPSVKHPGTGLDEVFAFVPIMQKMGKLAGEIEVHELRIKEHYTGALKNRGSEELNEEEKITVKKHQTDIEDLKSQMLKLEPTFEKLKSEALLAIEKKSEVKVPELKTDDI